MQLSVIALGLIRSCCSFLLIGLANCRLSQAEETDVNLHQWDIVAGAAHVHRFDVDSLPWRILPSMYTLPDDPQTLVLSELAPEDGRYPTVRWQPQGKDALGPYLWQINLATWTTDTLHFDQFTAANPQPLFNQWQVQTDMVSPDAELPVDVTGTDRVVYDAEIIYFLVDSQSVLTLFNDSGSIK